MFVFPIKLIDVSLGSHGFLTSLITITTTILIFKCDHTHAWFKNVYYNATNIAGLLFSSLKWYWVVKHFKNYRGVFHCFREMVLNRLLILLVLLNWVSPGFAKDSLCDGIYYTLNCFNISNFVVHCGSIIC
jgi:hypothetical protein